jgi:hypothetical protein
VLRPAPARDGFGLAPRRPPPAAGREDEGTLGGPPPGGGDEVAGWDLGKREGGWVGGGRWGGLERGERMTSGSRAWVVGMKERYEGGWMRKK